MWGIETFLLQVEKWKTGKAGMTERVLGLLTDRMESCGGSLPLKLPFSKRSRSVDLFPMFLLDLYGVITLNHTMS